MKRMLSPVLLGAMAAVLLGCTVYEQKAEKPAETEEAVEVVSEMPPAKTRGRVFRVWRYGNGEIMALLGRKDGVREGDVLILSREGAQINTIEVLNVEEETFFGRVYERDVDAVFPKVGDLAVKPPGVSEPKPPEEKPGPESQ